MKKIWKLIISLLLPFLASAVGGFFTSSSVSTWYVELQKPSFNPPNWVFGPVWTVLYIMIASSIFLYLRAPAKQYFIVTVTVLVIHLVLNFVWTPLFFNLHSLFLALLDIILLDLTLICVLILFWKTSWVAGLLLIPYFFWVCLATYLSAGFFLLNRP